MFAANLGAPLANKLYVEDVFSTYTYTGNSSTQTINNGIDLAGKGGLVWQKCRAGGTISHWLFDTVRGKDWRLSTDNTSAQSNYLSTDYLNSFNSNGFSLGSNGNINGAGTTAVAWAFRKAQKFFDVVTWIGNGASSRTLPHALSCPAGFAIGKITSNVGDWRIWHRNDGTTYMGGFLNSTGALTGNVNYGINNVTSTSFDVNSNLNASGETYVAYLFAHDSGADGLIQCGSFATDGSGAGSINHGWTEGAQYLEIKAAGATGDWEIYDTARTSGFSGNDARLRANLSSAEDSVERLSASGTTVSLSGLSASTTYIYTIVRAPAP